MKLTALIYLDHHNEGCDCHRSDFAGMKLFTSEAEAEKIGKAYERDNFASSARIRETDVSLTHDWLHKAMLERVEVLMRRGEKGKTLNKDEAKELSALAGACEAYETVMYPIGRKTA